MGEVIGASDGSSRIEWLELFFDLVAVAAVAVLTEGLREDVSWGGTALFVLLYTGIWFGWVSVVLYANLAGAATRTPTVLAAMFLVAVMAASAPIHFADRANTFALGFLGLRLVAARGSLRTGRVLASWPALQFGGAIAPWVISLRVDTPWKYWLWAVGLTLDLGAAILREQRVDRERLSRMQQRIDEHRERDSQKGREPRPARELAVVDVEPQHLQERLGLFAIIVLGEAVSQLVLIAAKSPWTREFKVDVIVAFLILAGLWWLTFSYGFFGSRAVRLAELPLRFGLPLHLLMTIGIVALAAGFGTIVERPDLRSKMGCAGSCAAGWPCTSSSWASPVSRAMRRGAGSSAGPFPARLRRSSSRPRVTHCRTGRSSCSSSPASCGCRATGASRDDLPQAKQRPERSAELMTEKR